MPMRPVPQPSLKARQSKHGLAGSNGALSPPFRLKRSPSALQGGLNPAGLLKPLSTQRNGDLCKDRNRYTTTQMQPPLGWDVAAD